MEHIPAEGTWPLCCPRSRGQHGSGWRAPGIRPPCRESCSGARVQAVSRAGTALTARSVWAPSALNPRRRWAWKSCPPPLTSTGRLLTRESGAARGGLEAVPHAGPAPTGQGTCGLEPRSSFLCAPARGPTSLFADQGLLQPARLDRTPQHSSFITRCSASLARGADHPMRGTPGSCCPKSSH